MGNSIRIKFACANGFVTDDWNKIPESLGITSITVGLLDKLQVNFSGYEQYMFQFYGLGLLGDSATYTELGGFQVGAYKKEVGWVIMDINLTNGFITTTLSKTVTTNAIKNGI
jgi:hypothetical protein